MPSCLLRTARAQAKSEMEKLSDPLAGLANSNASLLVCRICGKKGDHWTSKCPYKDLAASKGMALVRMPRPCCANGHRVARACWDLGTARFHGSNTPIGALLPPMR